MIGLLRLGDITIFISLNITNMPQDTWIRLNITNARYNIIIITAIATDLNCLCLMQINRPMTFKLLAVSSDAIILFLKCMLGSNVSVKEVVSMQ